MGGLVDDVLGAIAAVAVRCACMYVCVCVWLSGVSICMYVSDNN